MTLTVKGLNKTRYANKNKFILLCHNKTHINFFYSHSLYKHILHKVSVSVSPTRFISDARFGYELFIHIILIFLTLSVL